MAGDSISDLARAQQYADLLATVKALVDFTGIQGSVPAALSEVSGLTIMSSIDVTVGFVAHAQQVGGVGMVGVDVQPIATPIQFVRDQAILRSPLSDGFVTALTSGVAHWCYVGKVPATQVYNYISCMIASIGSGTSANTAFELAVAVSSTAPNGTAPTLYKAWCSSTTNSTPYSVGGPGVAGLLRTTAMSLTLYGGQHVWLAVASRAGNINPALYGVYGGDTTVGYTMLTPASTVTYLSGVFSVGLAYVPATITNVTSPFQPAALTLSVV